MRFVVSGWEFGWVSGSMSSTKAGGPATTIVMFNIFYSVGPGSLVGLSGSG